MNTMKKMALLCLSLLTALTVAAGCNLKKDSSGGKDSSVETSSPADSSADGSEETSSDESSSSSISSESNSSTESSDKDSSSGSSDNDSSGGSSSEDPPSNNTLTDACDVGEWQLISAANCTEAGEMGRYCSKNSAHYELEEIPARGHNYQNNGLCECGATPTLPTLPDSGYVNITKAESGVKLSQSEALENEMYNRYVLSTGTLYTAETVESTYIDSETFQTITEYVCWIQFSVPEAGQYAVISRSNPNNLTIARYDASAHYVNPKVLEGRIMDDGNFISTVSVNEVYFNEQWITACCIKGTKAGETVDFSIVRIDEPAWAPTTIYERIYATDIKETKAPEGAEGTMPTEVPYETSGIYFDETKGYYCMPDGSVIYAAITMPAPRQFGGGTVAFSDLLSAGSEGNFIVHTTTLPNGNPLVHVYTTMMLANPYGEGYNANSYEAQVNSDGLYPVTKELYAFLQLHASRTMPATPPEEEYAQNAWLAPCYYYQKLDVGSQEYPASYTGAGTYVAQQTNKRKDYYFTLQSDGQSAVYSIKITTPNVRLNMGDTYYESLEGDINLVVEVGATEKLLFSCKDLDMTNNAIDIVITEIVGSYTNPIVIDSLAQPIEITPVQIVTSETTKYEVCYAYTITESGTLTLTTDSVAAIMLGNVEVVDGTATLTVEYNTEDPTLNVIKILVTATSADSFNATLSFANA